MFKNTISCGFIKVGINLNIIYVFRILKKCLNYFIQIFYKLQHFYPTGYFKCVRKAKFRLNCERIDFYGRIAYPHLPAGF